MPMVWGWPLRRSVCHCVVLVIDADVMGDDFPECKGFKRAMINPVFLEKSEEEVSMEEGCLSCRTMA